mgnify:CR=1 FL=1
MFWPSSCVGNEAVAEKFAFQMGTLQGAYLMLAARAVGLDTGGMGGFDPAKVDAELQSLGQAWEAFDGQAEGRGEALPLARL